jgi:hypothetical protein
MRMWQKTLTTYDARTQNFFEWAEQSKQFLVQKLSLETNMVIICIIQLCIILTYRKFAPDCKTFIRGAAQESVQDTN